MFKDILYQAMITKKAVSIFTGNASTEEFILGFVLGITDDHVLLANISAYGFYDGYAIERYNDIFRCDMNDMYSKQLSKLYYIHKQSHPIVELVSDSLLIDLLQHAINRRLIVSIELHCSGRFDVRGYVVSVFNDVVKVKLIDDYGNEDGESYISLNDISYLICDSSQEMAMRLLHDNEENGE